jgi:hypothetical protein
MSDLSFNIKIQGIRLFDEMKNDIFSSEGLQYFSCFKNELFVGRQKFFDLVKSAENMKL